MVLMLARLPVAKLFLLGVRQAARPVSKVAMAAAERSRTFQDCCAWAAGWIQSDRMHLPREQAVQAGCTMLGESVVFGVSGVVLVYEYHKSKEAERRRVEEAQEVLRRDAARSRQEIQEALRLIEAEVARQGALLEELWAVSSSASKRPAAVPAIPPPPSPPQQPASPDIESPPAPVAQGSQAATAVASLPAAARPAAAAETGAA